MSKTKKWSLAGIAMLAVFLAFFPIIVGGSAYYLSIAIEIGLLSIFAMSYDLLIGYTGIVSFGHAMFFGLGAYITGILMRNNNWGFIGTVPVVIIACGLLGLVIGLLTVRVKDTYFSMMTLALGQLFFVIATKAKNLTGGDDGLPGVPLLFRDKMTMYFVITVIVVLAYLLLRRLTKSPTGKTLQAIRENETRANMIGYNVLSYKLIIICISSILAGFAGSLYVTYLGVAYPLLMHSSQTMQAIFMTIIGGSGTLYGPIIGAVLVKIISTVLSAFTQRWMLIFGVLFVICVMLLPGGVVSIGKMGIVNMAKRLFEKKDKSDS
ncbi:MAG: branched-chain amino acid ABC transporter permease [Christensenellales bacterium]